jgi:hypothetical protein
MSETTGSIATAMASMDAVETQQPNSAPQAEPIAETQAEEAPPPASGEETADAPQTDATETPSRAEKRIQQLLQRERELRERNAYLEGLAQRQAAPAESPKQQAPAQLSPDLAQWVGEEPKPDAFPAGEFDPQFLRAIARFEARHEQAQMVLSQRQHAARQAEQARAQSFYEQADKVAVEKPDFREVVGTFGQSVQAVVANAIAEAGAEVAYAIAKDPEASARMRSARTMEQVAREIGRFEARLDAAKASPPAIPQPSNAPAPPPKAVRGASAAGFDWSKASPAEIQARINGR